MGGSSRSDGVINRARENLSDRFALHLHFDLRAGRRTRLLVEVRPRKRKVLINERDYDRTQTSTLDCVSACRHRPGRICSGQTAKG